MSRPVVTVPPMTQVIEVLELAAARDIRHLPIVAQDGLVGLVCLCDLQEADLDAPVSGYMHRHVVTAQPDASVDDVVHDMDEARVGSLVVVEGDEVVGIVTRADLEQLGLPPSARFCYSCGASSHLRRRPEGGHLCVECADRSGPAEDDEELGGSH